MLFLLWHGKYGDAEFFVFQHFLYFDEMLEGGLGVYFQGDALVFRPIFDDFFQFVHADFFIDNFAVFQVKGAVFVNGNQLERVFGMECGGRF